MQNLIIDGNYILMKAVFTLHKLNRLYGDLWTLLDNNIDKYRVMNTWEKIIVVSDSRKKSWRKKELDKYKGTRIRQDDIDWEWVFNTYDEWKESISDRCIIFKADHIEGDDWITSLVLKLNKNCQSNVIISSDHDLFQLINYRLNGKKSWINIQISDTLGKEHIYLPEGWELWLNEFDNNRNTDVFSLDNSNAAINFFNRIINNWQYTEINSHQQLFEKIIQGDKSDNIDSIYQKVTLSGKLQGIGKAGAHKIWNFYKENFGIHYKINEQFIYDIITCLEKTYNIELNDSRKQTVINNIKLNIKLIELHYKHYPDWVLEKIINTINEKIINV